MLPLALRMHHLLLHNQLLDLPELYPNLCPDIILIILLSTLSHLLKFAPTIIIFIDKSYLT